MKITVLGCSCAAIIIYIFTVLAGLFSSGCTIPLIPDPEHPELEVPAACDRLCAALERYHCPGKMGSPGPDEEFGTEDDVRCREQCEESVSAAPWLLGMASCGAVAGSCEEIDKCMEANP